MMRITSPLPQTRERAAPGIAFYHMLVCVDRSETAEAVLPLATHLAQRDGAKITLLHVL
jgi:K+-sensing histidine kinase KdpD